MQARSNDYEIAYGSPLRVLALIKEVPRVQCPRLRGRAKSEMPRLWNALTMMLVREYLIKSVPG